MPNILAIETSGKICSVALTVEDVLHQETLLAERQHSQQILSLINRLLEKGNIKLTQLDAVAFSAGPGSFTGIRLAASLAQGLAYGAGVPVIAVSTLQALAQSLVADDSPSSGLRPPSPRRGEGIINIAVATNAYGGYIYWGLYQLDEQGIMQSIQPEERLTPEQAILPPAIDWLGVGDAWLAYNQALTQRLGMNMKYADRQAHAKDILTLACANFAQNKPASQALPTYLYSADHWRKSS
jgi:tRNA threonylcarbamoyladenosine biosynthesis protein TsaB